MSKVWSWLAKVLLVITILGLWYIYQQDKQYQELFAAKQSLEVQIIDLESQLEKLQQKNTELEKKSVDGILRETNKVVISGWETLLNKVEQELDKAKTLLQPPVDESKKEESPPQLEENSPTPEPIINGERT